jgi:hypothetical protein
MFFTGLIPVCHRTVFEAWLIQPTFSHPATWGTIPVVFIPPSTSRSVKCAFLITFRPKCRHSRFFRSCYMSSTSQSPCFAHPNNTLCRVRIMKLFSVQFSPVTRVFSSLYFQHLLSVPFPYVGWPGFVSIQNYEENYLHVLAASFCIDIPPRFAKWHVSVLISQLQTSSRSKSSLLEFPRKGVIWYSEFSLCIASNEVGQISLITVRITKLNECSQVTAFRKAI